MLKRYYPSILGLLLSALGVGCGAGDSGENVGQAELEISTIPSGVACIKVTGTVGSTAVSPPLVAVTAGASSTSISLGQLPFGAATFNGAAYNLACASVTSSSVPTWVADPASTTLSAGTLSVVPMVFRKNNVVTASATFVDNIASIAVGYWASYARLADGTVLQWGNLSPTPTPVPGLANAVQVTAGNSFACARRTDGSVACWGASSNGELGPGLPIGSYSSTPVVVPLPGSASDVAAGQSHACAAVTNMGVYCWGNNVYGQLGNGTTTNSATPVGVPTGAGGRVFAGGFHSCAIGTDGTPLCWGLNSNGQVGDGTTTNRLSPYRLYTLRDVTDLALGGYHTCSLRADSSLRCWGLNGFGELGDGTFTQRLSPTLVPGLTDATQVTAGWFNTCTRRATGTVSCWGYGETLGDGVGDDRFTPGAVPGLSGVISVRSGNNTTCADLLDHTVKCWGENGSSQVGDGTSVFAPKPTDVKFQ